MDSVLGEHVADVGSLVEMVGKKDQRCIFQFRQIHSFPLGKGMVLADEQLQIAFPEQQTMIGFFRQPVGDAKGKIDFLPVQEFIEDLGGFFHRFDGDLGMGLQEGTVDLGKYGIAPHGGNPDPDQGLAGTQGMDYLA